MAASTRDKTIVVAAGRFARHEGIDWWDQRLLAAARVLVVGAGALGNEVIKNLALLGVGSLAIADMDRIEASNLSRSVLFRQSDEGQGKAETAAAAAMALYPQIQATPLTGNVLCDLGLGWFRWAHVVVGALDNREARLFVNSACALTARPWVDGGIDVLNGVVRGFAPPATACYECTMGQADWNLLNQRRSCSLLARQAFVEGGTPTTATTASVIGAMQAQEVVKRLHGLDCLDGAGFVFEGLRHSSYAVSYVVSPDCPWHEAPAPIEAVDAFNADTPMRDIADLAMDRLGGFDAIDLSRQIVQSLHCPACDRQRAVMQPIDRITADQAVCDGCGGECWPRFISSIDETCGLLDRSARQIGLPAWDVVWARHGAAMMGVELAGDRPSWPGQ